MSIFNNKLKAHVSDLTLVVGILIWEILHFVSLPSWISEDFNLKHCLKVLENPVFIVANHLSKHLAKHNRIFLLIYAVVVVVVKGVIYAPVNGRAHENLPRQYSSDSLAQTNRHRLQNLLVSGARDRAVLANRPHAQISSLQSFRRVQVPLVLQMFAI